MGSSELLGVTPVAAESRLIRRESTDKAGWRQTFKYFDRNGDGTISAEELKQALYTLGQERSEEEIKQMLVGVGSDCHDGLDFTAFVKLLQEGCNSVNEITRTELVQMYTTIDIDCSGYLTAAELKQFMANMNIDMEDSEMTEMISMYDLDGNGQISASEFECILTSFGYTIVEDIPEEEIRAVQPPSPSERKMPPTGKCIRLDTLSGDARDVLSLFDYTDSGEVYVDDLKNAADVMRMSLMTKATRNADLDPALHWDENREKRGLGKYIYKANHIAIIVSDVGRSAQFYANVIGLQQIRRPDFDKHGAWFTMGNVELHLIKGVPIVHTGDDLIVNHISLETYDIDKVPHMLRELGIPFRQNVSVPKGGRDGGQGTNDSNNDDKIIRQYFFRDPDGYYLEVCNCMLLTDFCLGKDNQLQGYQEGVEPLSLGKAVVAVNLMQKWSGKAQSGVKNRQKILEEVAKTDGCSESIARILGCEKAEAVDENVLKNLIIRRSVYGDICQNETEESVKEILLLSGNSADLACEVMHMKALHAGQRIFQPPAFYEEGDALVKPPPIIFKTN